jgi:GT2 family glycosyltransferase
MAAVCAIVPTFNRADLIGDCLESLLRQTRPLAEIVVVNDGSTDGTREVLKAYAGRIRVVDQANAGKASALNRALAECRSDYVWICDDDDIAEADACAVLAGALDADPAAGFSYGSFRRFMTLEGSREVRPMSYWPAGHESDLFLALAERCFIFQFSSMVRRTVYDAAGPFDEGLLRSQDYDMCLRIARRQKGVFVGKAVFLQRQHAGSRGAAGDRFSADLSERKWVHYDQIIFKRLLPSLSQDELTPSFAKSWRPELRRRAAALQHACIAGRHALWSEAVAALGQACEAAPAIAAMPGELDIAGRMLAEQGMVRSLAADRPLRARLRRLVRQCAFGKSMAGALARPLFWQARNYAASGEAGEAWRRLRLLVATVGVPHAVAGGAARLARPSAGR